MYAWFDRSWKKFPGRNYFPRGCTTIWSPRCTRKFNSPQNSSREQVRGQFFHETPRSIIHFFQIQFEYLLCSAREFEFSYSNAYRVIRYFYPGRPFELSGADVKLIRRCSILGCDVSRTLSGILKREDSQYDRS